MWRTDYKELKTIPKDTTELWVRGRKIKNLDFLNDFKEVKKLFLSSIKTNNLYPISSLKHLTHLELTNVGNGSDLNAISQLNNLEELILQTPSGYDGSGKVIKYLSLKPISDLSNLKELTLLDVVFEQDGLKPLLNLKSLTHLTARNKFSTEDFAKIDKYRPDVQCEYANPYNTWDGYEFYRCNKCGEKKVEFSGVELKRRVFCPHCNKKKFEELLERYNQIKSDA